MLRPEENLGPSLVRKGVGLGGQVEGAEKMLNQWGRRRMRSMGVREGELESSKGRWIKRRKKILPLPK